jgi:ribose transport system substrate-binding protein
MSAESRSRPYGMTKGPHTLLRALALVAVAAIALTACGSSSSMKASSSGASSSAAPASTGSSSSGGQGVDVAAAQPVIAPYTGHTTAFPVDKRLSKALPAGTKFAYLQCGAQSCALAGKLLTGAVKVLGGELTIINSGSTSASAQAAASSVLALKPAALILAGIDPRQYGDSLRKIADAGIKIVSISVAVDTKPFGITADYLGAQTFQLAGKLMADWVVVNKGAKTKVAFYSVPEITFTPIMEKAFQDELTKNCSSCQVRNVQVGVQTLGTTAPRTIATDLQSHPDTTLAVFSVADLAAGVPAALSAAGLSTSTVVFSPNPGNLEDIKNGKITVGLGIDFQVSVWVGVDVAARLVEGDQPLASEQAGDVPLEFLGQKDITFNASHGWTGYPDYPQRFAALWHPAA